MGGTARRGQVLAASADGITESRGEGYPDRLCGWVERVSRSHRDDVSQSRSAALHCAHGESCSEVCAVATKESGGGRSAPGVSGSHCGGRGTTSVGVGAEMEGLSQCGPGV